MGWAQRGAAGIAGVAVGIGIGIGWFAGRVGGDLRPVACKEADSLSGEQLFILDGDIYSKTDVPPELRSRLFELQRSSYEQSSELLQSFAAHLALAKEQDKGSDPRSLPPLTELSEDARVTESEIREHYNRHKRSFPAKVPYERVRGGIEEHFRNLHERLVLQKTWRSLLEGNRLAVLLPPPLDSAVPLFTEGFPGKGPKRSSFELVVLSDYRSNWSGVANRSLAGGDDPLYRLVMIPVPMRGLHLAESIVERTALCVYDQQPEGFWNFHQSAIAPTFRPIFADDVDVNTVLGWAINTTASLGIEEERLKTCLQSSEVEERIKRAYGMVTDHGVNRLPAFFLNGQRIGVADTRTALLTIQTHINQLSLLLTQPPSSVSDEESKP